MAGNYPDVPNNRIDYDASGAIALVDGSQQSVGWLQTMNSEAFGWNNACYNCGTHWATLILPIKYDITGVLYVPTGNGGGGGFGSWSADTTNGVDGTWTGISASVSGGSQVAARTEIRSVSWAGLRALTFYFGSDATHYGGFGAMHLYGKPTAGEAPDRLEIWQPATSARVGGAYFDWGNAPRSSTADKQFRIKNLSSTLTANSINLTFSALTDTSPSVPGQYLLSTDGVNFTGTINLSSLAPGGISSVLYARRVTPSNAVLSLWQARLNAVATSWT